MTSLLTNDGKLICPQCGEPQNILAFTPLNIAKGWFASECMQILKCKLCRHLFAPKPGILAKINKN
jgi:hypothetical protein